MEAQTVAGACRNSYVAAGGPRFVSMRGRQKRRAQGLRDLGEAHTERRAQSESAISDRSRPASEPIQIGSVAPPKPRWGPRFADGPAVER